MNKFLFINGFIHRLIGKLTDISNVGVARSLRIVVDRALLKILALFYGFHPWHADSPNSARLYRNTVAEMVSDLHPDVVVEVGCGLGGIISNIHAVDRYGYDIDEGVIKAARFLHGKKVSFICGELTSIDLPRIDVLILVNWIHEVSPASLEEMLTAILPRTHYLVLDAIDADNSYGYLYKHDFEFLAQQAKRLSTVRHPDEGRSFQLYEVAS